MVRHSSVARGPTPRAARCSDLHQEQRVEHDRFGEGDGQNRLDHDLRRRAGIAADRVRRALPINPTPMAAPSAARPTCKLAGHRVCPFSSEHQLVRRRQPARMRRLFVVLTDQQREDGGQQHEDQRLHQPDQQLHEIERNRQQPAQARNHRGHRLEHVLAGEDVAVEPEAQRDRPEEDRHDLEAAGSEEHDDHQQLQHAGASRPSARTAP